MPKAKVWSTEERRVASVAYVNTSYDCVNGRDQSATDFWKKIELAIPQIPTSEPTDPDTIRTASGIKSFLQNTLFRDVAKFNGSLMRTQATKPTGATDQHIINMAVAYHLNKAQLRDYKMIDFDPYQWANYSSWLVLQRTRKFQPTEISVAVMPHTLVGTHGTPHVLVGTHHTEETPRTEENIAAEENHANVDYDSKMTLLMTLQCQP